MIVFWKLSWREIRYHPGRSLLLLFSVAIGVAAVVAVTISTESTQHAFDDMYQSIAGRADLAITGAGNDGFDESVVGLIDRSPGVLTAAPIIERPTVVYFQHDRTKVLSLGIDLERDRYVHDYVITAGQSMREAKGILLDATLARQLGVTPDDTIKLLTRRGLLKVKVVGLFQSQGTVATGRGATLLMPLHSAQYASKMPKKVSSIQVVLQPNVDNEAVQTEIASRLPAGLRVERPSSRSLLAEETSLSTQQGMNTARAFSLLVAVLIITNTFMIAVTQRRRQFGIMRAIGATQRQVTALLCCEAVLMGLLGSAIGWVAGAFAGQYLTGAMGTLYETTLPVVHRTYQSLGLAVVFGLGISLMGVALPARRASGLSPLEAMRETLPAEIEGNVRWLSVLGVVLVIGGGCGMAACIQGWLPTSATVWSGVLILAGLIFLMQYVVPPLASCVAAILRPAFPVEGRLAHLQLLRHRRRTTLTIGILFVAISTGVGLASSVIDNVNDVKNWYRATIVADFFVRAMAPDMATGTAADLPDDAGTELSKIEHITSIETARFVQARANDQQVIVVAHDYRNDGPSTFVLTEGSVDRLRDRSDQDTAVIGSVLSERAKLHAGDTLTLETDSGTRQIPIAAVVNDYLAGGRAVYLQRDIAKNFLGVTGVDAYIIHANHQYLGEVQDALQRVCDKNGLLLQSFSDIQHHIDEMMAGVVAGLWALVVLGSVIAAIGVANTLMMNVLEQTRELALLRIVGTTQWQVRKTILAQALILGVSALVPGTVAGVMVAYLISRSSTHAFGHPIAFVFHPLLFAGGLIIGLLVVILAAWFPAERAARMQLLEAARVL